MNNPEKPDEPTSHDSLFGQAAAGPPPGPVLDHEPEPPPPPSPPEADKIVVRRGGTPLLLTLLITAALGGGGYWAWSHPKAGEVAASPAPAADSDTTAKLQALSDRVDKLEKAPSPQTGTDVPAKLQALADRLDKLEKAPPSEQAPAAPASSDAAVDMSKKLDDLTAQVSALSAKQDELSAGLSKMQEIAAQKPADITTPAPDHSAQELASAAAIQAQQQVADLGGKTSQALSQEKAALDALEQRLAQIEQTQQTEASAAQAQSASQITALDSRIGKLEQSEGQLQGATKDATLAVKLEAAQAALAAGTPLGDVPNAPPALQRFATTPPPTEAGLRAEFAGVSAAILAASRPEEQKTTFLSRALARVEQSVTVRQGDHVIVGDPAAGVVATAQARLDGGNLAGAVDALSALSGRAADAAKSWRDKAQALLAARAALLSMAAHG
jgi:hypothetical protein